MVRVLLDEGVPDVIQRRLKTITIATVQELGWRGISNGDLLDLMIGRFDVLVTSDKNIPFQQNLVKRNLSAIILPSNRIRILNLLLPDIESAIKTIQVGETIEISLK
ncbi:MAG TPA: hypothetical protein VE863_21990 [Pyrinomonadaceae bacterium]|jgi:hypothetical protein|nr:hypothetical protein [Pyrinomonadaceae bacterium]